MGIIGSIRKHSGIAVTVVGVAIVAFIIGDLRKNNRQEQFGKIDGDEVTYNYYNSRVSQREETLKAYGMSNYGIKEQVWQEMIQESLLGKEMKNLGIEVGEKEMNDMFLGRFISRSLQQQFTNTQTGEYDREYVRYIISQFPKLPDTMEFKQRWLELEQAVRQERQQEKYLNLIYGGMYMPMAMAEKIAEINSTDYSVRVAAMLYSQAGENDVTVTDDDLKKYFESHKKELNATFFRTEDRQMRELMFVVFTAMPTQEDMAEIEGEVNEWWTKIQELDGVELADFVNMHGVYDTMYYNNEIFTDVLDSMIDGSHAGTLLPPTQVNRLTKEGSSRYAYGEYVMGKVLNTEMRPDSIRASIIVIPNEKYNPNIAQTVEGARHLRDSAMAMLQSGMPFEMAVKQFSADTTNGGDQAWQLDGYYGLINEEIVHHNVGSVFNYDLPEERGHFIVKVTGKTTPHVKYRVALVSKPITPSTNTEKSVRDQANLFASQYTTVDAMMEGAQEINIPLRSDNVMMMSDSLRGFSNTREAVRWAYNENTKKGAVSGEVYNSDYSYLVVGLRDIYVPGSITFEQARDMIEPTVRIEKLGEQYSSKMSEVAGNAKDINSIAVALNVPVDTMSGVTFGSYLGKYGMEPKVVSAIAAKNGQALIAPVVGASGVYAVSVDEAKASEKKADAGRIRDELTQYGRNDLNYLPNLLKSRVKIVDNRIKFF